MSDDIVERIRESYGDEWIDVQDAADEIERLRERIKELKKENSALLGFQMCENHITDEQINAAWKDRFTEGSGAIHLKAELLGIEQCYTCGEDFIYDDCPDCKGEGWVRVKS